MFNELFQCLELDMVDLIVAAIMAIVGFLITDNFIHPSNGDAQNQKIFFNGAAITTITILFFVSNIQEEFNPLFAMAGIAIIGAYFYYYESSIHSQSTKDSHYHYSNHCWNCKKDIDSKVQKRCLKCGWYVCDECESCGCGFIK